MRKTTKRRLRKREVEKLENTSAASAVASAPDCGPSAPGCDPQHTFGFLCIDLDTGAR